MLIHVCTPWSPLLRCVLHTHRTERCEQVWSVSCMCVRRRCWSMRLRLPRRSRACTTAARHATCVLPRGTQHIGTWTDPKHRLQHCCLLTSIFSIHQWYNNACCDGHLDLNQEAGSYPRLHTHVSTITADTTLLASTTACIPSSL